MPAHMPHTFSFDAAEPYFASIALMAFDLIQKNWKGLLWM